jgi:hypothetical protein
VVGAGPAKLVNAAKDMAIGTSNLDSGSSGKPGVRSQFIEAQLNKTRRNVWSVELADCILRMFIGGLVFAIAVALLDHWVFAGGMGRASRALLWLVLFGTATWYIVRRLLPIFRQRVNPLFAADTIERGANRSLKNSLINWLQVRDSQSATPTVIAALEEQAKINLQKITVDAVVERQRIIRGGYVLLGLVVLMSGYKLFSPKDPLRSIGRILLPWADISAPSRVSIDGVEPGDITAPRGQAIPLSAEVRGLSRGEEVVALYSTADGQTVDRRIPLTVPVGEYRYRAELPPGGGGMQQNASYRLVAGDGTSKTYHILVSTAPTITVDRIEYEFPAYTGIPPYVSDQGGDIRALEGTKVTLHARANQPIKSAALVFNGDATQRQPLAVNGETAKGSLTLQLLPDHLTPKYKQYYAHFTSEQGQSPPRPIVSMIETLRDQSPAVAIISPEVNAIDLPLDRALDLEIAAHDPDFALSKVMFLAENVGQKMIERVLLDEQHKGPFAAKYHFDPQTLGLSPGDEISIWVEGDDNRTPEPNHSVSEKKTIRILAAKSGTGTTQSKQPDGQPGNREHSDPERQNRTPQTGDSSPSGSEREHDPSVKNGGNGQNSPANGDPRETNSPDKEKGTPPDPPEKPGNQKSADGQKSPPTPAQPLDNSGAQDGDVVEKVLERIREKQQPPPNKENQNGNQNSAQQEQQQPGGGSQKQSGEQPSAQPQNGQQSGDQKHGDQQSGGEQGSGQQPKQSGFQSGKQNPSGGGSKSNSDESGSDGQKQNSSSSGQNGSQNGDGQQSPQQNGAGEQDSQPHGEGAQGSQSGDSQTNSGSKQGANSSQQPSNGDTNPNGAGEQQTGQSKTNGKSQNSSNQKPSPGQEAGDQSSKDGNQNEQNSSGQSSKSNEQNGAQAKQPSGLNGGQPKPGTERNSASQSPNGQSDLSEKGNQENSPKGSPGKETSPQGSESQNTGNSANQGQEKSQSPSGSSEKQNGDPRASQGAKTGADESTNQGSSNPNEPSRRSSQSPGNSQKEQADSRSGKGAMGDGQKSPSPGRGSEGQSTASENGSNGGQESGKGDPTSRAGDQQEANGKTGTAGERSGKGTQSREASGEKSGEAGEPRNSERGNEHPSQPQSQQNNPSGAGSQNQETQSPGTNASGAKSQSTSPTAEGTPDNSAPPGSRPVGTPNQSGGSGVDDSERAAAEEDQANLEYAQKAADLVLEELKHQTDQDRPDAELLKRLGWTKSDLAKFVQRWEEMRKAVQTPGEKQEAAKEELSAALRSLGISPKNVRLGNGGRQDDDLHQLKESRRSKPPADYAEQFRAYQQGTARGSR